MLLNMGFYIHGRLIDFSKLLYIIRCVDCASQYNYITLIMRILPSDECRRLFVEYNPTLRLLSVFCSVSF